MEDCQGTAQSSLQTYLILLFILKKYFFFRKYPNKLGKHSENTVRGPPNLPTKHICFCKKIKVKIMQKDGEDGQTKGATQSKGEQKSEAQSKMLYLAPQTKIKEATEK